MDDLGLSTDAVGVSSMFTGEEEVFAFARAVVRFSLLDQLSHSLMCRHDQSRITEMGSVQWAQRGRAG